MLEDICLYCSLQMLGKNVAVCLTFRRNYSNQTHMTQRRGRAQFHTEITCTIGKGKDRKEAMGTPQCSHVHDLSVGSASHGHIISYKCYTEGQIIGQCQTHIVLPFLFSEHQTPKSSQRNVSNFMVMFVIVCYNNLLS